MEALQPATLDYLAALRHSLRRDRTRYATNFWRGVLYLPRDQGPAWDLFVT